MCERERERDNETERDTHSVSRVCRRCELFPAVPVELDVLLHVYDYQGKGQCCCCTGGRNGPFRLLGAAVMLALNSVLAHCLGLGLYHTGVEVGGRE